MNSKPKSERLERLCKGPVQNRFIQKIRKSVELICPLNYLLMIRDLGSRMKTILIQGINMSDPQCSCLGSLLHVPVWHCFRSCRRLMSTIRKMDTANSISSFSICFFVQLFWKFVIFKILKTGLYGCKELKEKPQFQMQVFLEILCLW